MKNPSLAGSKFCVDLIIGLPRAMSLSALVFLLAAASDDYYSKLGALPQWEADQKMVEPHTDAFRFAATVGDGMILAAAPKRAMVWGFCAPGATVDVAFAGSRYPATIAPDQATGALTTWRVLLPATASSFAQHSLNVTSGSETITLRDFMFGEVWVCSGQSNMQYPLGSPTCWNASNSACAELGPATADCQMHAH